MQLSKLANFSVLAALALTFLILPLAYSTAHGYTTWWFTAHGRVTVKGASNGFIHRSSDWGAVIITRTDTSPRQSYLVSLHGGRNLIHCGQWSVPHFPVFGIGDVNPPCVPYSATMTT